MNTIGLLLVLGLAFFALKQKSEKTRNMLLIGASLIGFCMFSAEGFMVTPNGACVEIATGAAIQPADTVACAAVTDLDDGTECNLVMKTTGSGQACTYAAPTIAVGLAAADLPLLFPSCDEGTQVKVGGTLGSMCEAATDAVAGAYSQASPPPWCACLKTESGEDYHCNSGWTKSGSGKYIAKNALGTDWVFKADYADEANYKCDPDTGSSISSSLELFSGKCFVPKDEATEPNLALCGKPTPSSTAS
jgi:hypothetical protein